MAEAQANIPPYVRQYETIYVLKPEFEDPQVLEVVEKMRALVAREGGKTIKISNWGKKKLAYEVKGNQKGIYVHHLYVGPSKVAAEYERNLRIMDPVVLHQTVVLEKNVLADKVPVQEDSLVPPVKEVRRDRERGDDDEFGGGFEERRDFFSNEDAAEDA
ncbi:MAG: 30S ribosomal protein S6 [Deltaproteobacteria bacterium]|nr:30S ribosomal protein S6 [Deltaproteobacteria bacterium]